MKGKIFKLAVVVLLIVALTGLNILFVGNQVVLAIYEELESQKTSTTNKNVSLDAFLGEEDNVHSKQANIQDGEILKVIISVRNGGVLNDGKIKLLNEGLYIQKDKVSNVYVKSINEETNEIELNQIANVENVQIDIPVKLKTSEKMNIDYFNKETTVNLTGSYKEEDKKPESLEGNITVRIIWTEEADIALSQKIEKYLQIDENSVMLQQAIETQVIDKKLPKEQETIEVQAPLIDDNYPENVVILQNGRKIEENYQYNKDDGKVTINNTNTVLEGNLVEWGKTKDTYKVIYFYPSTVGTKSRMISLQTVSKTKLYTKDEITKTSQEEVEINNIGTVNSFEKEMTESVYKGYLKANVNTSTDYQEKLSIEISNVINSKEIEIMNVEDNFETNQGLLKTANTYIKEIVFEKEQIKDIFGEEFSIEIKKEDGTTISTFNKDMEVREDGKIYIQVGEESVSKIIIKTTAPVKEGNVDIIVNKAIKSQTGYTKEELKTFQKLIASTQISSEGSIDKKETSMELKDTEVEERIQVNQNEWSTFQTNENIQITAILKSNSIKNDLYKNPVIKIQLPEEIADINVTSIRKLYADEMEIESAKLYKEDRIVEVVLKGEQTEFKNNIDEGIQFVVNADITIDKMQPSKEVKIQMISKNDNRMGEEIVSEVPIQLNSKYGTVLYNSIEGFNNQNEKLEGIAEDTIVANLETGEQAKNAKIEAAIVNNYEGSINDVKVLGKLPDLSENEALKSTILTNLTNSVAVEKEGAKIYYSTEILDAQSEGWQEKVPDLSTVKMFKIEIPEVKAGEVVPINYTVGIPENVEPNQIAYETLNVNYLYAGQNLEMFSNIKLESEKVEEQSEETQTGAIENVEGLEVEIVSTSQEKTLSANDQVKEGQVIKNQVTITNKTGRDLNKFSIEAFQLDQDGNSNVTYFNQKAIDLSDVLIKPDYASKYVLDDTLTSKKFEKDVLTQGETVTFTYEFSINAKKKDEETTKGNIVIKADGYEQQKDIMENKIQDGKIRLVTEYSQNDELPFQEGDVNISFFYRFTNMSDQKLENIRAEIILPDGISYNDIYKEDGEGYKYISSSEKSIIVEIPSIEAGADTFITIWFDIDKMEKEEKTKDYNFYMKATIDNEEYYSNVITKTVNKMFLELTAVQESDVKSDTIVELQEVEFTTTITNKSLSQNTITIEDVVDDQFEIKYAYLNKNGERVAIATVDGQEISAQYSIGPEEVLEFVVKVQLRDGAFDVTNEISHYVAVLDGVQRIETNVIEYKVTDEDITDPENPSDPNNPTDPSNPSDPNNPNQPSTQGDGKISGVAWIDANRNGIKDDTSYMNNLNVILINNSTGEIAKNANQNDIRTRTNSSGEYTFSNIVPGNYIVAFIYDNTSYEITNYQTEGVTEDKNSDVISKTITLNGTESIMAVTNEISSNNDSIENIDAGFYQRQIFDLSMQKSIGKVIVQTSKETKVSDFNGQSLAKVEIKAKEMSGATVIVEYKIKVTNEGEVAGYAKQIADYLPKDLSFNSEINKDWYMSAEGILYSDSLANTIINPGESKELTLTLTKTMTNNNTGTVVNTAEITNNYNELNISDKDSVAGNRKDNEDDISSAELIISVSTGAVQIIAINIVIAVIIGLVILSIYMKKREEV